MISSPKNPAPDSNIGNVTPNRVATNQGGIPLPWFVGRRWLPLNWGQSRIYNPQARAVTSKVGKSTQTTGYNYFGDLFGLVACCQVDYIEAIEIGGTIIWSGGGGSVRDGSNPDYFPISMPDGSSWRFYWGTPTQTLDSLVLATCGEDHPRYLDQAYLVGKDVPFGSNNSTPPSIRVLVEREPVFAGIGGSRSREGGNPVTTIAELIGDDWFGLGRPDLVNSSLWDPVASAVVRLKSVPMPDDSGYVAPMGYISPFLERQQSAQEIIAQIMEYFDGWLRPAGAQLEIGRFPHDGVMPTGLSEFSYHDFTEHPRFTSPSDDEGADTITDTVVVFSDRDYNMEDNTAQGLNAAARKKAGESRTFTSRRPFIITNYQAQEQAQELAKILSRPEASAEVYIRRERLGTLREGDRFILNDAPSSYRQVIRIAKRTDPARGGEVQLSIVEERGLAPLTFVSPPNPLPDLEAPALVAITHARIFQLPTLYADFGPAPAVVPLAQRPGAHIAGYRLDYSADDATYDRLDSVGHFALRGTLVGAITNVATSLTLSASGFDLALLQSQSDPAKADDSLLLICGFEIMSIGAVAAIGGGQYTCAVLRGRRGSVAAAASSSAECYVIPRADLEILQHANFPRTISVRYFKLATYTPDEEQLLADALKITFTFDDTAVAAPSSFTAAPIPEGIKLQWINPIDPTIVMTEIFERTAATPVPGSTDTPSFETQGNFFNRSALASGLTRYYWVRNRDTIGGRSAFTGPASATSAAGGTGPTGPTGNHIEFRYKRSTIVPGTPTGDHPSGWFVDPAGAVGSDAMWRTQGEKTPADTLVGTWSTPTRVSGTIVFYPNGSPSSLLSSYDKLEGDIAYDISDGNKAYRWDGTAWIDLTRIVTYADFGPGIKPVEKLSSLPTSTNSGRLVLLTTDFKLYRDTATGWSTAVDGTDIVADTVQANALSAGSVTAYAVGTNLLITNTANIGTAVIVAAHISTIDAGSITGGTITAGISLASGGSITAGSGYSQFYVDDTVLQYGALQADNFGSTGTELNIHTSAGNAGMLSSTTGTCEVYCNNGAGNFSALRTNEVRTTGTFYGAALDLSADATVGGDATAARLFSANIGINDVLFNRSQDGKTPPLYTGDLSVAGDFIRFGMSGGELHAYVNGSDLGAITFH